VNPRKEVAVLEEWRRVKRQFGLADAQVQMGRELEMNPRRLLADASTGTTQPSLARRVETLYLRRFHNPLPDSVRPLREVLHEARARERAETEERRRRKRQAERDHAEAARVSLVNLWRLCNAVELGRFSVWDRRADRSSDTGELEVER
jgi:hypothetical protein